MTVDELDDEIVANAKDCEQALLASAKALANARNRESQFEDERALVKASAIKRIMEAGNATSVTAAEKIVESDAGYMQYRAGQRQAVMDTLMAAARWEAAKMYAAMAGRFGI